MRAAETRRVGRPSRQELAEGERRADILRVAEELFRQRGFAAVSLSDVAARVGVTKATILHHFGSKRGLYAAVMRHALAGIAASIRVTAAADAELEERLLRLAHVAIVWVDPDADLEAMLRDAAEHLDAETRSEFAAAHAEIMLALEAMMRDAIARGALRPDDPRLLAHVFWHLLGSCGGRRGSEAGFQGRPEVAVAIVDLFLRGARASPVRSDPAAG
jgi:AcrR family transcriptional regulator